MEPICAKLSKLQELSDAPQKLLPNRKSSAASTVDTTDLGELDRHTLASSSSPWSELDGFSRASSTTPEGTTIAEVPTSDFDNGKVHRAGSAHEEMVNHWNRSMADDDTRKRLALMLSKLKIFGNSSLQFLELLAKKLQPHEYQQGEYVMKQGEHGDWLCIVLKGCCGVNVQMEGQTRLQRVGELRPGNCCGEMAMLGILHERMATITAAQPTVVLILSKDNLEQGLKGLPSESANWEHVLGRPLHVDKSNLKDMKFFSELTPAFVQKIQQQLQVKLFYKGEWLMKEGEYGSQMYILRRGTVGIFQGKENGHDKHIVDLIDSAVIGEMAVLSADKRAASVLCKSLCVFQVLQGDVFKRILADYPEDHAKFQRLELKRLVGLSRDSMLHDLQELNRKYGRAHPNRELILEQQERFKVVREENRTPHKQMPASTSEGPLGSPRKPRLAQIAYMALR